MRIVEVVLEENDFLQACHRGDVDFLRRFIEGHKKVEDYAIVDQSDRGPLHHAVASNSYECVKMLLSTNLVDIRQSATRYSISTVLSDAIRNTVSCDIIRLLLENDPHFFLVQNSGLIPQFDDPPIPSRIPTTIIDTLQQMNFPFLNAFDLLEKISQLLYESDRVESDEAFDKLASLIVDETATDAIHNLAVKVRRTLYGGNFFSWFFAKYYYSERNDHRNLLRKVCGKDSFLIYGINRHIAFYLHSDIRLIEEDYHYRHFADCDFLSAWRAVKLEHRDVVNEVASIVWPKIEMDKFFRVYLNYIQMDDEKGNVYDYDVMTSTEWLHITQLGLNIDIGSRLYDNFWLLKTALNVFMPFSLEPTADAYFPSIKAKLNKAKFDAIIIGDVISMDNLVDVRKKMDDCDDFIKYCVGGKYQVKCGLQSLCRASIRKSVLQSLGTDKSHSKLVKSILSLEIPNSLQQFLLFNSSDYEFKLETEKMECVETTSTAELKQR